ncbi:MAG: iron-sulfur cluster assembly accessory protein [Rhodospirillales bacterium]|nr:iron-sulfur cluster assembly accessory protein [Rhodospirillales bacterium]MCB9995813.1 iron-sulfur cluster assembly accessory protein [Rhodospirillales bacterium]
MSDLITMTDKAAEELKKRMDMDEAAIGVRLSITKNGCSGHGYKMEYVYEEDAADDKFEHNGAVLYLPMKDSLYVAGMEIDFERKNAVEFSFVFNNPNVESECGCGESFSVKKTPGGPS